MIYGIAHTSGFDGSTCTENIDDCADTDCGNGECVDGILSHTCQCDDGWYGQKCDKQVDWCADAQEPCLNGGTCFSGESTFTCVCTKGWTGSICSQDIDECSSQPCQNGATCKQSITPGEFSCACPVGYSGATCDIFTPAPKILSAKIGDSWDSILIRFDLPTNQSGNTRPCSEFVDVRLLGTRPLCTWFSGSGLLITSSDWTIFAGDVIKIKADSLYSSNGLSAPVSADEVVLQGALSAPQVVASLHAASAVSSCADILLDTSASSGGAGRELLTRWELVVTPGDNPLSSAQVYILSAAFTRNAPTNMCNLYNCCVNF